MQLSNGKCDIHQADISKILLEKDKVIETIGGVRSTVDNINNNSLNYNKPEGLPAIDRTSTECS